MLSKEQREKMVGDMIVAQSSYCAAEIGGLRNPNLAEEAMLAALAVAEQDIRDDVLAEAAKVCVRKDIVYADSAAAHLRAMKGKTP